MFQNYPLENHLILFPRVHSLQETLAHPLAFRALFVIERIPVDPVGDHHQHLGELLRRHHLRSLLDLPRFHGHLHSTHFSGVVAATNKSKFFFSFQVI